MENAILRWRAISSMMESNVMVNGGKYAHCWVRVGDEKWHYDACMDMMMMSRVMCDDVSYNKVIK